MNIVTTLNWDLQSLIEKQETNETDVRKATLKYIGQGMYPSSIAAL